MTDLVQIDGSFGEGGGQVLRTSLSLSLVTGRPFQIKNIRAGRKKPGLMRQHLTAVNAAAQIGAAEVQGASISSQELTFIPRMIVPGRYHFAVGTAGSCTLVLQTVLPALLIAEGESEITLKGGTHNPFAPPYDFLARTYLPLLNRMGADVSASLTRCGFYPAGGGHFQASVKPTPRLAPLELLSRGEIIGRTARALVSRLPLKIADRELAVIREELAWPESGLKAEEVERPVGPGNIVFVEITSEHITEVFTGFGMKKIPAETVAKALVKNVRAYLTTDAPVGPHLADQLLIPLAMAGGGRFRTLPPSRHTLTNIAVIQKFLALKVETEPLDDGTCLIQVRC